MNSRPKPLAGVALAGLSAFVMMALSSAPAARADGFTSQRDLLPPPKRINEDPPLPTLTPAERTYLIKLARRAMEHAAQTAKVYQPTDVPESLAKRDCPVFVSARQVGRMVDSAVGEGKTLAENIAGAAALLAGNREFGDDRLKGVRSSVIELDILGPGQLLPFPGLPVVYAAIIPGVHGLAARVVDPKTGTVNVRLQQSASAAPVYGNSAEMALSRLLAKAGWTTDQVVANRGKVIFFRFRQVHLLEQPGPDGCVELFRGAQLVAPDQVTRQRLDGLIDSIGKYMCLRQLDSGMFSYSYSPAEGYYQKGDNATRQAGSAWAMARLARATRDSAYELAAFKAIAAAKIRYLDAGRTEACAGYPFDAGQEGLGATALLLAATVDVPDNKPVAALRDKLAAGVLRQQQSDGSFKLYYCDLTEEGNKFYYPGEALLALMKAYGQTGDKRYLAAVQKAFTYYHGLFQHEPNRSFAPWHAQAWALAYDATGRKEYLDFVFQLGDYLVGLQADDTAAVYPDMVGAFINEDGAGGIGSAVFLEGVVAARRMAVKAGDARRADKYAHSLRLGARFLDQLTFKQIEAFYCLVPREVIGGVKMSPNDHTVRIDNCQHSLCALLGIRDELFPQPTTRPMRKRGQKPLF